MISLDGTPREWVLSFVFLAVGLVAPSVGLAALGVATKTLRPALYHVLYRSLGPLGADLTSSLLVLVLSGVIAATGAVLLGDYVTDRLDSMRELAAAMGLVLVVFASFVTVMGFVAWERPGSMLVAPALLLPVPVVLYRRFEVEYGGVAAMVGAIPGLCVLILLGLVLSGFAGATPALVAQEVDASAVEDGPVAALDEDPRAAQELFSERACDRYQNGTCKLRFHRMDDDVATARYFDRRGVRCPLQVGETSESVVARNDGRYYRIHCELVGPY